MNKFDFNNRTAVITGGAQGFGLDIAKRFLNSGAKVIIWDIDEELLKSAAKEVNHSNLSYNVIDVSNYSQIEKTVSEITTHNKIDILINNAGITGPTAEVWNYKIEDWNKVIEINLNGTFNCCKSIVPHMIKNDYGRIVNISSIWGTKTKEKRTSYTMSKSGINGLTKSLSVELARDNNLVNSVSPGFTNTVLTKSIISTEDMKEFNQFH